jgi:hypothetical protein
MEKADPIFLIDAGFIALLFAFSSSLHHPREMRQVGRDRPRRGGAQGCAPFS